MVTIQHQYNLIFAFIMGCLLAGCSAAPQNPAIENGMTANSIDELMHNIEDKHPITYSVLASKLYFDNRKDEATVWYYIGDMRFTTFLKSSKEDELIRSDQAMFASNKETLGRMINEYGSRNPEHWVELINQAIAWHESHPDNFTPKAQHPIEYQQVLNAYRTFRDYIADHADVIKAKALKRVNTDSDS